MTEVFMRSNSISIKVIIFMFLGAFILMLPTLVHAAQGQMNNYCIVPPYVKTDIDPNIYVVLDNSQIIGSWAYGDETDSSVANTYKGSQTLLNDLRYEGLFDSDLRYTYNNQGIFMPDNGGTNDPDCEPPVNSECGEPGAFDGNLLNFVATSRYDLIMSILIGGTGTPQSTSNFMYSINDIWRDSFGVDQTIWPEKVYWYRGDADGDGAVDTTYRCYIELDSTDNATPLEFSERGLVRCGLLLDPPVGPVPGQSYSQAFLSAPDLSSPVMYAGPLSTIAEEDILTKEEREKMQVFVKGFTDYMLGILGPTKAYAAGPLKFNKPKNTSAANPYTFNVQVGEYFETVIKLQGGSPPCGAGDELHYCYQAFRDNPADSDLSVVWNSTLLSHYLVGTPDPVKEGKNYDIEVDFSDGTNTATAFFNITFVNAVVAAAPGQYDINVCAGDYDQNCGTTTADLKEGLLQSYWPKARFGYESFQSVERPVNEVCIGSNISLGDDMGSFGNKVKLATPVGSTTEFTYLVDGVHEAIKTYMGTNDAPQCDPFKDDEVKCRNNFILLLTSAEGADLVTDTATKVFDSSLIADCDTVTSDMAKNTCYAANTDLRNDVKGNQTVSTFIVDAMSTNPSNSDILKEAAIFGGGEYYSAEDPSQLRDKLEEAFKDILSRAASGTAASVLASGEGSGANLMQAVYYPRRRFLDPTTKEYTTLKWFGRMANFWYYIDPFFSNSNIREEVSSGEASPTMNLKADPVIEMAYDAAAESVIAYRWDDIDGDGTPDSPTAVDPVKAFERVGYIWEAGLKLWKTDPSERTIYISDILSTPRPGKSTDLIKITNTTAFYENANLQFALGVDSGSEDMESKSIIQFIMGYENPDCELVDASSCRSRKLKLDVNADGVLEVNARPFPGYSESFDETVAKVWKLGDVLNSTPRIAATIANHKYDIAYGDTTYTEYVTGVDYQGRGLVFAGGNDGMLHAFRLGKLEHNWDGSSQLEHARLTGTDLGKEEWAFIPTDALPYLRYQLLDSYCHIYTVDQSPYLLDLSPINGATGLVDPTATRNVDSWRTIVIGGMRFGGACKNSTFTNYTKDLNGDGSKDEKDYVKTPVSNYGYSSYFALDITDPTVAPKLLWEFSNANLSSDDNLGYSTTGPTIVHIAPINSDDPDNVYPDGDANGYWYTVVGSGPTGPIDTDVNQFLGTSDQEMKFFVFETYGGPDTGLFEIPSGIENAFASSMFNISFDTRLGQEGYQDYTDDAMYIGYVQECLETRDIAPGCTEGLWNDGGVGRIVTFSDPDPDNWKFSLLAKNIGPVTAAPTKAIDFANDRIFVLVSTGRYYYVRPDPSDADSPSMPDDYGTTRHIAAFIDPCYQDDKTGYDPSGCANEQVAWSDLINVTSDGDGVNIPKDSSIGGWYITMDDEDTALGYGAERVITDLVVTEDGILFVTSFKPYTDECSIGGKSHLWAMLLDSGGSAGALLKGTAIMQVSTGSIEKIDLGEAFVEKDGRRSAMIEGKPPISQGLALIKSPPPVDRILHIIERDY
jgi:hypothetical protein